MKTINMDTPVGSEFTGHTKMVTSLSTWLFSGGWPPGDQWPARNIHTDEEFAKTCGLNERNAAGAMLEGYISELMVDMFGDEWLSMGSYKVKFIRTVSVGGSIVSKAKVVSRVQRGNDLILELYLWCENEYGDKVLTGVGSGRVS